MGSGRPPLDIGTYGTIRKRDTARGPKAYTYYRDYDGVTRLVERSGRTLNDAERRLKRALVERTAATPGTLSPETKVREIAERWFADVDRAAKEGARSTNTPRLYRGYLDNHVLPALGELRLREATVSRVDAFLAKKRETSYATAKTCRTVLSGLFGYAVRHEAIGNNPVRNVSRLEAPPKSPARAMEDAERILWLQLLAEDKIARNKDLPDLSLWMIATGVRIGEALAVSWDEIDLEARTVDIAYKIVRVKGKGLVRVPTTKTGEKGKRLLGLPEWIMLVLKRRKLATGGAGPVWPHERIRWRGLKGEGYRDPSNVINALRDARRRIGEKMDMDWDWIKSHVYRKTTATILDESGLTAREIADQLGHSRVSVTQDVYLGRRSKTSPRALAALEEAAPIYHG